MHSVRLQTLDTSVSVVRFIAKLAISAGLTCVSSYQLNSKCVRVVVLIRHMLSYRSRKLSDPARCTGLSRNSIIRL